MNVFYISKTLNEYTFYLILTIKIMERFVKQINRKILHYPEAKNKIKKEALL